MGGWERSYMQADYHSTHKAGMLIHMHTVALCRRHTFIHTQAQVMCRPAPIRMKMHAPTCSQIYITHTHSFIHKHTERHSIFQQSIAKAYATQNMEPVQAHTHTHPVKLCL